MKPLLVVLLCVSILFCVSSAGSYIHGHPFLMNAKTSSQGETPKINKRQADFDLLVVCTKVLLDATCTNGLFQEIAFLAQRCNGSDAARLFRDLCVRNSMGMYCFDPATFSRDFGGFCDISDSTCSSECRDFLINSRNQLGCCVNVYNDSSSPFSYSLWSSCGVAPVTEECSPSAIRLPSTKIDPTCTENVFAERVAYTSCSRKFLEDVRGRLSATEECRDFDELVFSCNANSFGAYCDVLSDQVTANFTAASESCINTSTCDPLCINTLMNITSTVGCCFNDKYNITGSTRAWLSDEFWSRCGLKSPGLCKEFLNDVAVAIRASSFSIISSATVAMMLLLGMY